MNRQFRRLSTALRVFLIALAALHEASLASHRYARAGMLALCMLLGLPALAPGAENPKKPASGGSKVLAQGSSTSHQPKYKPNEVLVRFRKGVSKASVETLHQKIGAQVIRAYRSLEGLQLVRIPSDTAVEAAIANYEKNPDVLYAEPNYIVKAVALPNDPLFPDMWGLNNTGQLDPETGLPGTVDADIDAPEAWDLSTGSSSVMVVDIDTGIDYNHQDLAANVWNNPGDCDNNGVDDDGDGWIDDCHGINPAYFNGDPFDDNGHGTHTAGTIGAVGNNSVGVVGVNWNVTIAACKFLDADGSGSTDGAVACLDWVALMYDRGLTNIVATNNSWGGGGFSQALFDAINANGQRGILFFAAAGNSSSDNDSYAFYPAAYFSPYLVAVAATDRYDGLAFFSNYGRRRVHIGAPGHEIWSTVPTSNPWCPGSSYCSISGTSMATPHVTGLAALLKAQDPNRDWRAIRNLILAGGDNNPNLANTITQKRINAFGSMTCNNSTVFSRLEPVSNTIGAVPFAPVTVTALNINCASPNGNVPVTVDPGGQTVTLVDDGIVPDQATGDGIYAGQWIPPALGTYTLTFPNGDAVTVQVLQNYTVTPTPFNWRTITGTNLFLWDDSSALITPGFPIPFAGGSFNDVWVGSNGIIGFNGPVDWSYNQPLPTTQFLTLVAPFWDDLNPFWGTDENVFWDVVGTAPDRELLVEWRNVSHYPGDPSATVRFQVVFFENSSNILFNYQDIIFGGTDSYADQGAAATVGVQVAAGVGTQFSFNTPSLNDNSALLWRVTSVNLNPPSLDYGDVVVGTTSSPQTITLGNSGSGTLTIFGISASGDFATPSNTCGGSVPVGGSCTVDVTFGPTALGVRNGLLTIDDDGLASPHTARLTGRGVSTGLPGGLPPSFDFGDQMRGTTSAPQQFIVANNGTGPLGIVGITTTGDFNQSNNCPASLPVAGTCNIDTTFTPRLVGLRVGTLNFTHDAAASPAVVELSGNGTPFIHPLLAWRELSSFVDPRTGTGIEGAAASLISGNIYVSHGYPSYDSSYLSFYDIATDTWTHGGPELPDAFVSRYSLGGGIANGRHYAVGGFSYGEYFVADNEEYDPVTHTWTPKAPMSVPRCCLTVASWNDKIYALGGTDESGILDVNEVYNPATNTWTTLAPMPTPVADSTASVAFNGKIYVFGGISSFSPNFPVTDAVQIYDIAGNTWSSGTPMPVPLFWAMAGLMGSKIAVFGGAEVNFTLLTLTNLYDPANDTWVPGPEMPIAAAEMAQGVTYDGSRVYAIGSGLGGLGSTVQVLEDRVQVSPRSVDFGNQLVGVASSPMTITLTNGMAVDLHISSITPTGDFSIQTNGCPATLTAGSSCDVAATFTPTAPGYRQGTITIADDGPSSPRTVTLSGRGSAPEASLTPTSLDFGHQVVGINSSPQAVVLKNTGDLPLNVTSILGTSEFSASHDCPSSLAPGGSCTVQVAFTPAAAGARSDAILVNDDAIGSPHRILVSGTGEDFAVGPPPGGSLSAIIRAGNTATFNLNLSATSAFNGTVTLSCSGAPPRATCTVLPNSVQLSGGGSATAIVTVKTTASSMTSPLSRPPAAPPGLGRFAAWPWLLWLLLLAMLSAIAPRLERHTRFALAAVMLLVLLWAACGGGETRQPQPGTPPGTYPLTVTATYTSSTGSSTRSVPITLTVN